jgi:two-component system response regulator DesR
MGYVSGVSRSHDWAGGILMIRVLLAEDQSLVRGALAALLNLEPDIEVIAEVAGGNEVVSTALATYPDVALLDIEMPNGDGLSAASALHERVPSCKIIILTVFGRSGYLQQAMKSGAVGFILKDTPPSELVKAIRTVLTGAKVVDPELALTALSDGPNPLTLREREVLASALDGAGIATIAQRVYLSEGTVRNHISVAIQKLGVQNRLEAARAAEQKGWL